VSRWLDCPLPQPNARLRLVCLPHAGGSAAAFRDWGTHLPGLEVHAVRYPGRAERIDEPTPSDIVEMAGQIAEAVAPLAPLALFGHSLGAVVALETARALDVGGTPVEHLIASGSRAGPLPVPDPDPPAPGDPASVRQLIELGGTDPALAADPAF